MGSKAILLLGLFLAFTLLTASEVAPNDLPETSNAKSANGLDDAKYGGGPGGSSGPGGGGGGGTYCRRGCCRRDYHGECIRCCNFSSEVAEDLHPQAKPNN